MFLFRQFSVRGMMNSFGFLFNSFGALIAFCTAVYLDYRLQAICALIIPCLFVFVFYFVPESPIYLQNKNRIEVNICDKQINELS